MRRTLDRITICMVLLGLTVPTGLSTAQTDDTVSTERGQIMEKVQPKIPIKARPFGLKQLRLLDGPFKTAMEANRKYLHSLDSDRLLHNFRVIAGLPSSVEPLGGWEKPDCELRGHFVGHFLSGCALTYASTGDEALKAKAEYVVSELAKCRDAVGTGYLSAYPESFIDRVEALERVWAPYYTLHKIFAGLIDMYVYCGNEQALQTAERMAGWVKSRTDKLDDRRMQDMLTRTEQGGMNDTLCNLYAITGKPEHLALARRFDENAYVEPLSKREDALKNQHANSFIPNVVGHAREYELTGEKNMRDISVFFWEQVALGRTYVTGGTSNGEVWRGNPNQLANELSRSTHETCCTYNMLKLTRHLFSWEPDVRYMDYYERGLFNGILSTINPNDGMTMYYIPMESGHYKTYSTPNDSFWCCTGTGVESPAKYADTVFFYDDKGLFVNLFLACELSWPERSLKIRQETRFPEEEGTTIIIAAEKPTDMALRIRVPYWAVNGATVKINGETEQTVATPSSYLTLKRTWKDGDKISVSMPMSLRLHPMPDDASISAIMYGPTVLAGVFATEPPSEKESYGTYAPQSDRFYSPDLIKSDQPIDAWVKPAPGDPLTFRTQGVGVPEDVELVPFYKIVHERYSIYWKFYDDKAQCLEFRERSRLEEDARRDRKDRTIDNVWIGGRRSDEEHNLRGEKIVRGEYNGRKWIQADDGGWFSYTMKVLPGELISVSVTYWGADSGGRAFDILVDDTKIADQALESLSPGQFVGVEYKVSQELTKSKETIELKFRPHPGKVAGAIFGCATLKSKQ